MTVPPPLVFTPILKPRVWGGDALKSRSAAPPDGPVGESWELVDIGDDVSRSAGGATLRDLLREHGDAIVGPAGDPLCGARFPLLLKLLDARADLSVQVHPDDGAMRAAGRPGPGKSEAWYVLHAEPGARVIRGLAAGVTLAAFGAALRRGRADEIVPLLLARPVAAGDLVALPAGTIHALGAGVRVVEIQRASDVTYRLFDWGRPRELHVDEGLAVAHERPQTSLAACGFAIDTLRGPDHELDTKELGFHLLTVVRGRARVTTRAGSVERRPLDSVLVPSASGRYGIEGTDDLIALVFRRPTDGGPRAAAAPGHPEGRWS
jgi:mannose-6-phosphate isomerase